MKCRVKLGAELPHDGAVLTGGMDVDLPPHIAVEVKHLVEEVLPGGETRPIGAAERAAAELRDALDRHRPHERVSLLEAHRDELARQHAMAQTEIDALDVQIAAARATAAAPPAAAPTTDAKPEPVTEPARAPEVAKSADRPTDKAAEKPQGDKPAKDSK